MKPRNGLGRTSSPYPLAFREQVAREYLFGDLSYRELAEKYRLTSRHTVREWVKQFRIKSEIGLPLWHPDIGMDKSEKDTLLDEIRKLKEQLEDEKLRALAAETMIDVAEGELGIEIRKKSGTKPSKS